MPVVLVKTPEDQAWEDAAPPGTTRITIHPKNVPSANLDNADLAQIITSNFESTLTELVNSEAGVKVPFILKKVGPVGSLVTYGITLQKEIDVHGNVGYRANAVANGQAIGNLAVSALGVTAGEALAVLILSGPAGWTGFVFGALIGTAAGLVYDKVDISGKTSSDWIGDAIRNYYNDNYLDVPGIKNSKNGSEFVINYGTGVPSEVYTVKAADTLYNIAKGAGFIKADGSADINALIASNPDNAYLTERLFIQNGQQHALIKVGDKIKLAPPTTSTTYHYLDGTTVLLDFEHNIARTYDATSGWFSQALGTYLPKLKLSVDYDTQVDKVFGLGSSAPTSTTNGFTIGNSAGGAATQSLNDALPPGYLTGLAIKGNNWQVNTLGSTLNGDGLTKVFLSYFLTDGLRPGAGELSGLDWNEAMQGNDALWNPSGYNFITVNGPFDAPVAGFLSKTNNFVGHANSIQNIDPLVLDLTGAGIQLSSYQDSNVLFNMDGDYYKEQTGWVKNGTAFLVFDKNGDGVINDVSEMFSEYFTPGAKNGLAALATFDANKDGVFNANDAAYGQVRVWQDLNGNGQTDAGELTTLASLGITSINLTGTPGNGSLINGNEVQVTSTMVRNGITRAVAAINFLFNPEGNEWDLGAQGITVRSETGTKTFTLNNIVGTSLNVATLGVSNIFGNAGNDTLIGDGNSNWLGGGAGSDSLSGGGGDDVLIIDAQDLQAKIDGGTGFDIVQVAGSQGVNFNLSQAHIELAVGGIGDDILVGGGTASVYISGGGGNDIVIGSGANDALSGNDGNDFLDGGYGDDIVRGGRGEDLLIGGAGNDVMDGGLGNDVLQGDDGNDVFLSSGGIDTVDGGNGSDTAQFRGSYSEYTRTVLADGSIVMTDKVAGRDGTVTMKNVEFFNFDKLGDISVNNANPLPVNNAITVGAGTQTILAATLLANDIDYQNNPLHITTVGDAIGGTVLLNAAGNVVFTPTAGYNGIMSFSYKVADSLNNPGMSVIQEGSVTASEMKAIVKLLPNTLPTDPLLPSQWYLTEANITPVWKDYTGQGIKIGVFEPNGIFDFNHPDLKSNTVPTLIGSANSINTHATLVAGVIGSAKNGLGGVGVAYSAQLDSLPITPSNDNFDSWKNYDVVNNSWVLPEFQNNFVINPGLQNSLSQAASVGRDYSGTIMVFAAGNDRAEGGDANTSTFNASRWGIQVGAINQTADLGALVAAQNPFSNHGASILISAPGSNVTSTSQLFTNQDGATFGGDYQMAQGTSFATPIVSGIAALILDANPSLGYRDVQEILAYSAKSINDPTTSWSTNGAKDWNGGGLHYSNDYGFGEVDALAAVRLAETWNKIQTADTELSSTKQSGVINAIVPDAAGSLIKSLTVADNLKVEHVEVVLNLNSAQLGDLVITLIAPDGTQSVLLSRLDKAPGTSDAADRGFGLKNDALLLNSTNFWGGNSNGVWQLKIEDKAGGQITTLKSWELRLYGDESNQDNTYVYTNEFSTATGSRLILNDASGVDTLNISAVSGNSIVDLVAGHTSTIAGKVLTIGSTTSIENVYAGDGNDTLLGSAVDNYLWGGRGNDSINGAAGNDILEGNAGNNTLTGGAGNDIFEIIKYANAIDTITDFALTEKIFFYGFNSSVAFSALSITQSGADAIVSLEDNQKIILKNILVSSLTATNFITGVVVGGTAGADFITGGIGSDNLNGNAGNDTITGEPGDNIANYWGSTDVIRGGDGNDLLVGGAANDAIHGDNDNDNIEGDRGDDTLYGDAGNDTIQGNWGLDTLYGGDGADALYGNQNNDLLNGGLGSDTLFGNTGNDTLIAGVNNTANGGGDLLANTLTGNEGNDLLYGAGGNDSLWGSAGADTLYGADGNDTLVSGVDAGGAGDTSSNALYGGNGDDLLYGAQGSDTLSGDAGNDIIAGGLGADSLSGGAGNDVIQGEYGSTDTIGSNDTIYGGDGNDTLLGGFGDDYIAGDLGDDVINGGVGNDTLIGGAGAFNDLYGEAGSDTFIITSRYAASTDIIWDLDANNQNERIDLTAFGVTNNDWNSRLFLLNGTYIAGGQTYTGSWIVIRSTPGVYNPATIMTDPLTQKIFLNGVSPTSLNDYSLLMTRGLQTYWGTIAANNINGSNDNDVIYGGDGNDILNGFDGLDRINGQAGNDTIFGGYGADTIDGGAGNNTVSYADTKNLTGSPTPTGVVVNLATSINTLQSAEGDRLINVQNVIGSIFADSITGDANDNILEGSSGADTLIGGAGIDTVSYVSSDSAVVVNLLLNTYNGGHASGDQLNSIENLLGSAFNDSLTGNAGANLINGGLGNDTLIGDVGNDTLIGGAGADSMDGGGGIDTVSYASATSKVLVDFSVNFTSFGDAAGDILLNIENIIGSNYDDNFTDSAGSNLIQAGDGGDVINGSLGADTIDGGTGLDQIWYGNSTSAVSVNLTTNVNVGGYAQGDKLSNIEILVGSNFNDLVTGDIGNNRIDGGTGNDTVSGGAGNDTLVGGLGFDVFVITNTATASTVVDFVRGTDKINLLDFTSVSALSNMTIVQNGLNTNITIPYNGNANSNLLLTLTGVTASILTASDFVMNAPAGGTITGTTAADTLNGTSVADTINALAGNDTINGGLGNDTINASDGDDLINSGLGNDSIDGGLGIDTVSYAAATVAIFTDIGSGDPTLFPSLTKIDQITNVENVTGSSFNDSIAGNAFANTLNSGAGNDTVFGMGGNDTIYGVAGNDNIHGGDGNDVIIGGAGGDVINGDLGLDTVSYLGSLAPVQVNLGLGTASGGDALGDSITNIENISGSSGNDTLIGDSGGNSIGGGSGNDSLDGGIGIDTLLGGLGNDTISGGDGNDQVTGGTGVDMLTGGLNADRFIYTAITDSANGVGNRDIITDFSHAQGDLIDLSTFAGTFSFLGTGAFTGGVNPEVHYLDDGTNTIVQVDANHDKVVDFEIQVNGHVALLSTDFVL